MAKNKGKSKQEISPPMEKDCPVCFMTIERVEISCSNDKCDTVICEDCADVYFGYSLVDKVVPKCTNCGTSFYHSDVKLCAKLLKVYNKCCVSAMTTQHGETSRKELEKKELIERLRRERYIFIESELPAAIALTAKIAMPNKLRKLNKQKVCVIKEEQQRSTRSCMNLMCKGSLNEDFVCMTCATSFCKDCEKRKKTGHKCKEEDVKSIELIKNTIKCPRCKLPVEKSSGCNYITCSNCQQKFTYNDGKVADHGSSNAAIKLKEEYRLHTSFEETLKKDGLLDLMVKLELNKPSQPSVVPIQSLLINMYKDKLENDDRMAGQIAKAYEKYIKQREMNARYHNCLIEMEELLVENKLTRMYLLRALDVFLM